MLALRAIALRSSAGAAFARSSPRAFTSRTSLFAQGDYGGPQGDPKASNPQEQGENPKVDQEHPGPPPPSAASGGSSQSSQPSGQSKGGAQPKIHNESQPPTESAEVKKHNEEVARRSGKQADKDGEKVDPKFWKGHAEDKK